MKLHVALVLLFIGAALAQDALKVGQPDCSTELQMTIKNFKHQSDRTKFWTCSVRGTPATLDSCPEGTIFIFTRRKCANPKVVTWRNPDVAIASPEISVDRFTWQKMVVA